MKKTVILFIVMCLAPVLASAQWKVASMAGSEPNTKLLQVIDTENSTLVYATLSKNCDDTKLIDLSRSTCVKVNGMKYKILNSVNLPLMDEAEVRYAQLQKGSNEINFVMEFEKFPAKDGFDIIENDTDGEWHFNFHGVTVSPITESEVLDTKRFLDSGAPVIAGRYAEDGQYFLYYIRDGLCITCNAVAEDWGPFFKADEIFYLDIVNDSDHGAMFDFEKVTVVGEKDKKGTLEQTAWSKYTPESYDSFLAGLDYDEARYKTSGALDAIGEQVDREKYKAEYGSWERTGLEALGALTEQAIENRVNEYLQEHPKDRPAALKSQSLKSGDSIHGYIAAKKQKKADQVNLTIPMDGHDFVFTFTL